MKKIFKSLVIAFIALFASISNVFAAGSVKVTLSAADTVVNGNNTTISVNISNITGASDGKAYGAGGFINYDSEYLQYVSYSNTNGWSGSATNRGTGKYKFVTYDMSGDGGVASGTIAKFTFKVIKTGTTTITMTEPDFSDKQSTELIATVTNKTITITDPAPVLDSDSKLKSLSVDGYSLSPAFSSGTKSYSVTVPEGTTSVKINAAANSTKAKSVTGTGTKELTGDTSSFNVVVTAENNTSTTYTITVNRQKHVEPTPEPQPEPQKKTTETPVKKETPKVKSNNKNVDFKIISAHTIDPQFKNDVNDYKVIVPYDVSKLDLSVIPYDKNASVTISGNDKLTTDGVNVVTIVVKAEDGSTKTIKLNVTRTEYKANTDLLDLKVKDYTMSPNFKPSITKYNVTVPYKVKKVELVVKAPKDATYKITGNNNLQVGKNTVLVKVTDKKDFVKYYQVIVTRKGPFTIFGLRLIPFLIILFLLLFLLLLLLLLLKRRKDKKEEKRQAALIAKETSDDDTVKQESPIHIDFKPEFNFNSKNGTDDDVVYSDGAMINGVDEKKLLENQETIVDAKYDIYDDVVTKDELVDALNEGIKTKNVDKLQMLLDQENLNRKKKRIKEREESKDKYEPEHSSDEYDDSDEE